MKTSTRARIASALLAVMTSSLVLGGTVFGLTYGPQPEHASMAASNRTVVASANLD